MYVGKKQLTKKPQNIWFDHLIFGSNWIYNCFAEMVVNGPTHDSFITGPLGMQTIKGAVCGPETNKQKTKKKKEARKRTSMT